uniref:hypothetical protein n=1 Tax=Parerythrobacter lutipelagi TaxID=1964208 RepID=UPI0010F816DA|nr:hypothetical protein [Parerythrobacter lutipelagi]
MSTKLLIAAVAATIAVSPVHAQSWSSEQSEVWTFVSDAWAEHAENGTWYEVVDPNGYGWNSDYPVPSSRDQMRARNNVFGQEGEILYRQLDPVKISVNGDTAIAYYYANLVEKNYKGERETSVERCADTLIKRDGAWRFLGWACQTKTDSD